LVTHIVYAAPKLRKSKKEGLTPYQ
jgi:hypothetical protein